MSLNQPVLTSGGTLASVNRNDPNITGARMSELGIVATDADGSVPGYAVVDNTANAITEGVWQYTTNGTNWSAIGTVSATNALMLSKDTHIRFLPAANYSGTPGELTIRALDNDYPGSFSVSANSQIRLTYNTTYNGGADLSADTATIETSITAFNWAPTLQGSPISLESTTEDTDTSAYLVSSLLTQAGYGDLDGTGASTGIAITAASGRSDWEYSIDGITWTSVGAVSSTSSLLLNGDTYLRYAPDRANGEAVGLTFRGWDHTTGVASATGIRYLADTTSNGGATAFSAAIAQATLEVIGVNDAPILTFTNPTLLPLTAAQTNNGGQTVASLVGSSITDVDTGALGGIAVTAASSISGVWQYSTNQASWTDFGTVGSTNALLLRAATFVRFVPDGSTGETPGFTYHAWDQTTGTPGAKADTTMRGGTTAFSNAADTAMLTVTSVPVVLGVAAVTPNGSYRMGDTIVVRVTFSEAVTITGNLSLEIGNGNWGHTVFHSAHNGATVDFSYTLGGGTDTADLDYPFTTSLKLVGGATVIGVGGNQAILTLPALGTAGSLAHNSDIVIDGTAPTISSVDLPSDKTYGAGEALEFVVKLSEAVEVTGMPRIGLTLDTGGLVYADYISGSGTDAITFRFTVASGQKDGDGIALAGSLDLNGGTFADAAGNVLGALGLPNLLTTGIRIDALPSPDPGPTLPTGPVVVPIVPGGGPIIDTPAAETFKGSGGTDMVVFAGARANYVITRNSDGTFTIKGANAPDTLDSIERLRFDDGVLALDVTGNPGLAYRLYEAAFDRAPDAAGLGYWIKGLDGTALDLLSMARAFMFSNEFKALYGDYHAMSTDSFLTMLYKNILGRAPEGEGFGYWQQQVAQGASHEWLLAVFSESAENITAIAPKIADGIWYEA